MNLEIAVRQSVRYLFPEGAIVGSFKNTIRWNQPRHDAGSFIADSQNPRAVLRLLEKKFREGKK